MDALEVLKADHVRVAALFEQAEKARDEKQLVRLFEEIKQELELHTRSEETIFYPACARIEALKEWIRDGLEEHRQVKLLIHEIERVRMLSDRLISKMNVLQENVEQHVDEEESELFPLVRKLMNSRDLELLGAQLLDARGRSGTGLQ